MIFNFFLIIVSIISFINCDVVEEKRQLFHKDIDQAFNFTGKVAFVTGAGGTIGSEIARLFCYLGAHITIINLSQEKLKPVAEECYQLSPYKLKV